MPSLRRPARATLASLALALMLGACNQASEAPATPRSPSPTSSGPAVSPTDSPSPSALAEPLLPAAASAADTAGAEAFARYAIDVLNHASATGDATRWNEITAPDCETCVSLSTDIEATGPSNEGAVTIESTLPTEINPGSFFSVALKINQAPSTRADGSQNPGGRYALLLALRFTDGWTLEALDVADPDVPWAG